MCPSSQQRTQNICLLCYLQFYTFDKDSKNPSMTFRTQGRLSNFGNILHVSWCMFKGEMFILAELPILHQSMVSECMLNSKVIFKRIIDQEGTFWEKFWAWMVNILEQSAKVLTCYKCLVFSNVCVTYMPVCVYFSGVTSQTGESLRWSQRIELRPFQEVHGEASGNQSPLCTIFR